MSRSVTPQAAPEPSASTPTAATPTTRSRAARWGALAAVVALTLGACAGPGGSGDLGRTPEAEPSPSPSTATSAPPAVECADATQSYDPVPDASVLPEGASIDRILSRGSLVVGVSADTLLMGARDPFTGQIEGFDIDVLRDLSTAIFGSPDHLTFRVISSSQRIPVLQDGDVDVVARTFTATCARWEQIAFSATYFEAGQKVLVAADSTASTLEDLSGQRVCAPAATTTLSRLEEYPDVEAVPARTHTECLAMFQLGQVDAITGDDTILAGFAAQDPYAKVVGEAISSEPYGLGFAADDVALVRLANAVLAQRVADGRWQASYDRWLAPALGEETAPVPHYGRQG